MMSLFIQTEHQRLTVQNLLAGLYSPRDPASPQAMEHAAIAPRMCFAVLAKVVNRERDLVGSSPLGSCHDLPSPLTSEQRHPDDEELVRAALRNHQSPSPPALRTLAPPSLAIPEDESTNLQVR